MPLELWKAWHELVEYESACEYSEHSKLAPNVDDKVQTCFCVNAVHMDQSPEKEMLNIHCDVSRGNRMWTWLKLKLDEAT